MGMAMTILLLTDGQRLGLIGFAVSVVVLGVVIGVVARAFTRR